MSYQNQTIINNNSKGVVGSNGTVTQTILPGSGPTQNMPDFSIKTLYQKINQIISTPKPVEFAKAITLGKEYETIEGGYIEYGDIFPTPQANFNESAFVPTDLNFDTTGTGVLSNNRNDVHNNWQQKYRFVMPLANDDSNYYQFIVNYKKSAYKNKLLDEEFISKSLATLNEAAQLLLANRIINGFSALGPTGIIQYDGLKQLIQVCKEDQDLALQDAPHDLAGYSAKYVDLSYSVNDLDTLSKLNTILDKMANTSSCFCYGTDQEGTDALKYVSNGAKPIIICWNKMRRSIEMKNYQFYKNINEAILGTSAGSIGGADKSETGFQGLVTIPETTLDVRFVDGNKVSTLINITNNITSSSDASIILDLADDEILLMNPNSWVLAQFDDMLMDVDNTSNNVTATHTLILHGNCQGYLPVGTLCIVKCPKLLEYSV